MQGGVYRIRIQGHTDNEYHPHVVILDCEHECVMVPGFSSGGYDLEQRLKILEGMQLPRDVVAVELDNAKHVQWKSGWTGNRCQWFVWRCQPPISKKVINASDLIGKMDADGIRQILLCMWRLGQQRFGFFSKNRLRRIKGELAGLGTNV